MVLGSSDSDSSSDADAEFEADDEAMSSPNLTDTEVGHTSSPSGTEGAVMTEGAVSSPPLPTSPESVLPPVADEIQSQEREGTAEGPTVATIEMDDNNQEK